MADIEVVDLAEDDIDAAVALCARAFRDSPGTLGLYGQDPLNRLVWNRLAFGAMFRAMRAPPPYVARLGDIVLGVCAVAPPGKCFRRAAEKQTERPLPDDASDEARNLREWLFVIADHDLDEPHQHVGPVAVEIDLQGMGIGSMLLDAMCRDFDARGEIGWLETDKPQNVRLYERFGFDVTREGEVLGVHHWFMRRAPNS